MSPSRMRMPGQRRARSHVLVVNRNTLLPSEISTTSVEAQRWLTLVSKCRDAFASRVALYARGRQVIRDYTDEAVLFPRFVFRRGTWKPSAPIRLQSSGRKSLLDGGDATD